MKFHLESKSSEYTIEVGVDFYGKRGCAACKAQPLKGSCSRNWFARIYDSKSHLVIVELICVRDKQILFFIKLYASPDCPYATKIRDGIRNNLDFKSIFTKE